MCISTKTARPPAAAAVAATPPSIIDATAAARSEEGLRRRRSSYAQLNRSGRMGDISQPSLTLKTLMGS